MLLGFLFLLPSCVRQATEEPSPFGPSGAALTFELEARPNVLLATSERPVSEIRATVRKEGSPLHNAVVYFTILAGPGMFSDYNSTRTIVLTDNAGVASITYLGPTKYEIGYDQDVYIRGQLETSTPNYIHKEVFIHILVGN